MSIRIRLVKLPRNVQSYVCKMHNGVTDITALSPVHTGDYSRRKRRTVASVDRALCRSVS